MALTNFAQYLSSVPLATLTTGKNNVASTAGRFYSRWTALPFTATTPTTAIATDVSTTGSIRQLPAGAATWLKTFVAGSWSGGTYTVVDRLSQQGGLSGTVTTPQTTNLPTAALTRYTSGVGVMMGIEIHTTIGTSVTTVSCSYTNSAGTSGQISPALTIGGASDRSSQSFFFLPLQVGDIGVKSVESVTLAATTGTAGAFGVVLFKPLFTAQTPTLAKSSRFDAVRSLGALFESIPANACLMLLHGSQGGTLFSTSCSFDLIKQV